MYRLTESDKKAIIEAMKGRGAVSFVENDGIPVTLDSVDLNDENVVLRSVYYMNGNLTAVTDKMQMWNLDYLINDEDDVDTLVDVISDAPMYSREA